MANFGDMYKMEEMTDPAKGLNEPTSLALIYEDPDDNKKVYQQLDAKMKAKIKQKAKEEEKKKEKAKRDAEAKAKQAQEQAKAKEPEKAQAKQEQAKQEQAKQEQAKQEEDQAKQAPAKQAQKKQAQAKKSSIKKPTSPISSGTKGDPPIPDPIIPDPTPPDDPPPPPLPDVSTDLSEFIGGKKILLISDFEGTTPKAHFEKFSEYATEKSVVFLGDVFDNTAQPDKTCDGNKCPDPDEKDTESCITPENYCSLRTIRLLVDNPDNCRYVVGNRDVNKIKLLPFFALASEEKWWRKGKTYAEIVKNFIAIKKDESTWLVKTINYFKPFWNKKNYIDNPIWKTDASAGTTIYKRFELIFGKDPDKGTMAALVTLKSLPEEFMHQQGKNMLDFYKEIDATITEFNPTNLVLRNEIRATLTITLFMRMLDYAIVETDKIELGPTLGKLEGILYNYLSNAKPAYYATYNNDLFLFAHGGITEAFVKEKGDGAKVELEKKTNWKDVLDLTSGTASGGGSAGGGGTASGGGAGSAVDPENKIKTSIDIYNEYYFALLSQFFANPVTEVDKEEQWKPMLSLLKLTAGNTDETKYYPNQIKEPSYANLDAYRKKSDDSEYARVFNIFGHAAASSGYSFGRARDKNNVIVGKNTYFLATDYSTTLFKAGIACDKDKYDTNYLICILDTTTETETKLFIDGSLFLKDDKYHFDYYNKSDFETIKSIDEKLNDKMTAAPFLMIPMGLQDIKNKTIDIKFNEEINLLEEIEEIDTKNESTYCKFNGIATFASADYAVYSNMFAKKEDKTNMPYSIVLMPLIPASTPSLELAYEDPEIIIYQGSDIKKYKIRPPADNKVKYINFESEPATIVGFVLDKNTGTLKSIDPRLQKETTFPISVTEYTISAEKQFGRKRERVETTIKINIVVSDTDVTYKDIEGLVGKDIGSVLPDKTGDTAKNIKLKYAVSDLNPLPDGLTFNTDTGEISGTPKKYTPFQEYQITATDQFGYDDPVKVNIKIKEKLNIKVEYYDNAIFTGIVGKDIGLVSPTVTGSTPENSRLTYALVDPLPKGLELNPFTGKIYGIPTVITPEKAYQINVTDQLGNADPVQAEVKILIKTPMEKISAVRRGPRGHGAILGEEREWAAPEPVVPEPEPEPVAPEPVPEPQKRKIGPQTAPKPKPKPPAVAAAPVVAAAAPVKPAPVTPISSENPLMSNESLFSSLRDFLLSLYDPNYIETNLIKPNYILKVDDLKDNFLGLNDEIEVQNELLKVFPIEKEKGINSNWYNIYKTQIESKNNESKYPDVIKNIYEKEKNEIPLNYKPVQLRKLKADYIKAIKSHIIDFTMSEYRLRKNKSWSTEAIKSSAVMQKLGGGGTKKHTTKKHKITKKKHKKTMKKRVTKRKKNKRQRDKKNKSQKRKLIKKKKKTLQLLFGKK